MRVRRIRDTEVVHPTLHADREKVSVSGNYALGKRSSAARLRVKHILNFCAWPRTLALKTPTDR